MKSVKIILQLAVAALITLLMPNAFGEIVFSEDFESGTLGNRWERYKDDPARGGFETRPEHVHSGKKSYRLTALAFEGEEEILKGHAFKQSDAWIRTWFLPGHETVYIRWYAKFAEDFDQGKNMHWFQVWACKQDNPRSVLGGAGRKPDGKDRFIANVEPYRVDGVSPPGQIRFYTYWPDMKQSPSGYYWGNHFYPEKPFTIERDRWYSFEMMVKCNEPGKKDGEQALWVDGKEIMRVEGLHWRDTDQLKINMLIAGLYVHYCERDCTYWLDDLTISTEYVGPLKIQLR